MLSVKTTTFPFPFSSRTMLLPSYEKIHRSTSQQRALLKCVATDNEVLIQLPKGLQKESIPKHVAIIMDGNGRWARNRGLPVQYGHWAGAKALKRLVKNCKKFGVRFLTAFAFSTENWTRSKEEVDSLIRLLEEKLKSDFQELITKHDIRLSIIGNKKNFPPSLQKLMNSAVEQSKNNRGLHLSLALDYGGRYDITEAAKEIARKVQEGVLGLDDIDEPLLEKHLQTNGIDHPNPDLMIRTSSEMRVSNFMLWQLAYTELLFVDKLFPDFTEADLVRALDAYQQRQRRYGGRPH